MSLPLTITTSVVAGAVLASTAYLVVAMRELARLEAPEAALPGPASDRRGPPARREGQLR